MRRILPLAALAVCAMVLFPGLARATNVIQSIHHCQLAIANSAVSQTNNLSDAACGSGTASVVVANTILVLDSASNNTVGVTGYTNIGATISLASASTVTATRGGNSLVTTVSFEVIEFSGHVNSIQTGTIAIGSGATTGTSSALSAVGANAFVLLEGVSTTTATTTASEIAATVAFADSTHVVANTGIANSALTVAFMVVDLDSTIISVVDRCAFTNASSSTSNTVDITQSSCSQGVPSATPTPNSGTGSVTANQSLVFYNGALIGVNTTIGNIQHTVLLTNSTTVTLARANANTTSRTVDFTVVQFQSAVLDPTALVQRGTIILAAAASGTGTITNPVTTSSAFANWNNYLVANGNPNVSIPNIALTATNTVTATLAAAGSPTVGWEVLMFASGGGGATVPKQTLLGVGMLDRDDDEPSL